MQFHLINYLDIMNIRCYCLVGRILVGGFSTKKELLLHQNTILRIP